MSQKQLESILANGNVKACLKFFAKLSEDERRAMAQDVQALAEPIIDKPFIKHKSRGSARNPRVPAAGAAALAACSLGQIKKIWRHRWHHLPDANVIVAVFSARRPSWLDEWAEWSCERNIEHWPGVRGLVRARLCGKPAADNYTLGMIRYLCPPDEKPRTVYSGRATTKEKRGGGQWPPEELRMVWRRLEAAAGSRVAEAGVAGFFVARRPEGKVRLAALAARRGHERKNGVHLPHVKLYANLQA